MATLIDQLPAQIKALEESHGPGNPFVKQLKEQLRAMKETADMSLQDIYCMQAVQIKREDKK